MKIIKDIRNFVLEEDFKIIYIDNKVNIINYKNIDHFDNNKVMISSTNKRVEIRGNNLVVAKLLNDEILVQGKIEQIEFGEI